MLLTVLSAVRDVLVSLAVAGWTGLLVVAEVAWNLSRALMALLARALEIVVEVVAAFLLIGLLYFPSIWGGYALSRGGNVWWWLGVLVWTPIVTIGLVTELRKQGILVDKKFKEREPSWGYIVLLVILVMPIAAVGMSWQRARKLEWSKSHLYSANFPSPTASFEERRSFAERYEAQRDAARDNPDKSDLRMYQARAREMLDLRRQLLAEQPDDPFLRIKLIPWLYSASPHSSVKEAGDTGRNILREGLKRKKCPALYVILATMTMEKPIRKLYLQEAMEASECHPKDKFAKEFASKSLATETLYLFGHERESLLSKLGY